MRRTPLISLFRNERCSRNNIIHNNNYCESAAVAVARCVVMAAYEVPAPGTLLFIYAVVRETRSGILAIKTRGRARCTFRTVPCLPGVGSFRMVKTTGSKKRRPSVGSNIRSLRETSSGTDVFREDQKRVYRD